MSIHEGSDYQANIQRVNAQVAATHTERETAIERYRKLLKNGGLLAELHVQLEREESDRRIHQGHVDACETRIQEIQSAIAAMGGEP